MIKMSCRNSEEIMIQGVSLKTILENHMHWLNKDVEGWEKMRANLCNVNFSFIPCQLYNANFSGAMLTNCDFSYSFLAQINFDGADLSGCRFSHAFLVDATFKNANIIGCNFNFADCTHSFFENATLTSVEADNAAFRGSLFDNITINSSNFTLSDFAETNFKNAKVFDSVLSACYFSNIFTENTSFIDCSLYGSYIRRRNDEGSLDIDGSEFDLATIFDLSDVRGSYIEYRAGKILKESIIGYKKCLTRIGDSYVIVTLEIPKGSLVFSINGHKFRTNKAKVLDIDGTADRAYSRYNHMSYYVGDEITINDFNCRHNVECGAGIHFFMTKEEAINYIL